MRAILMYHSVDDSESVISIGKGAFGAHVRWLASGRVRVVPLRDLATTPHDADAVALTFDDGFDNFAHDAWPRLAEAGLPATVFVVTGHAGRTNDWGVGAHGAVPRLPLLGWDALAELQEQGVEIGAHTRTHPMLTRVPDTQLTEEVAASADDIAARLGRRPDAFAYPYGDVDARVAGAARRTYARSVTTALEPCSEPSDAHLLPRLDAYYFRGPGQLEAWGTPAFRRRLAWRGLARRARAMVTARRS